MICGALEKFVHIVWGTKWIGYTKFPCFLCLWDSRALD